MEFSRLLSEKEIKALSSKDLEKYILWVKRYNKNLNNKLKKNDERIKIIEELTHDFVDEKKIKNIKKTFNL